MYPLTYYETFMRYESSDRVFVAMPFTGRFQHAYEAVIEPAIKLAGVNGKPLEPRIVNRDTCGAPDIHEQIFDAVIHSRLVIADMTVQASCASDTGATRWQPNANVAYEVGLASAWRNPEDILLIHQRSREREHTYAFDVQNLRHVEYDPDANDAAARLAEEIARAVSQASFIANRAYQQLLRWTSPSALQFMHEESRRAFPVISFGQGMGILDTRIQALTELLRSGALRNRNSLHQGRGKGVAVIYQWTELGLRMLLSLRVVSAERQREMAEQIASVPQSKIPPEELRCLPELEPLLDTPAEA